MRSRRRAQARSSKQPEARSKTRSTGSVVSGSRVSSRRKEKRVDAFEVLSRMRRRGESLATAAREVGISPQAVRRHLPDQFLKPPGSHRYVATKADRESRPMLFISALGDVPIQVRGSRAATRLAKHRAAAFFYLRSGDASKLREFEGQKINGRLLLTDPSLLTALAEQGDLRPDKFYSEVSA